MKYIILILLLAFSGSTLGECKSIAPADSIGKGAKVPDIDSLHEGMSKEDVVKIFCRYPDHTLEDGAVLGWAYDMRPQKDAFDVRLKFDSNGKYRGNTADGLKVVVYTDEE